MPSSGAGCSTNVAAPSTTSTGGGWPALASRIRPVAGSSVSTQMVASSPGSSVRRSWLVLASTAAGW
jgi:hypothetical protein